MSTAERRAVLTVIDTDVLVSTAGHPDKRFAIWDALRAGLLTAVTSDAAIAELELVVARPRFRRRCRCWREIFRRFSPNTALWHG